MLSSRTGAHHYDTTLAILGGGVAGLSVALALTHSGVACRVFERSTDIGAGGMGFILMPDGMEALERLGCAETVRRRGSTARRAEARSATGALLSEKPLPEHVCILRRALLQILLADLPAGVVREGMSFTGFSGGKVGHRCAHFESDGLEGNALEGNDLEGDETVTAAAFVGADGKHSSVRELLFPSSRPEAAPVTELINGLQAPDVAAALRSRLLKFKDERGGLAVGLAAVGEGRVVWYVQFDVRAHPPPRDEASDKERFAREILRGWPEPLPDLVRHTDFGLSYLSEVVGMRTLPRLHHGDTVLVGDAAHPLPTLLGQGANAAVCDALLLVDALGAEGALQRHADPVGLRRGFARYSRQRLPAVDALNREGRARVDAFTRFVPPSSGRTLTYQ